MQKREVEDEEEISNSSRPPQNGLLGNGHRQTLNIPIRETHEDRQTHTPPRKDRHLARSRPPRPAPTPDDQRATKGVQEGLREI